MLGLVGCKAEVSEDISRGTRHLHPHWRLTCLPEVDEVPRSAGQLSAHPLGVSMELASHSPGSPPELLAKDAPNGTLERFGPTSGVLTQRVVDERLVTAAARGMHLLPEPVDHVVVEADSDPGLPRRDRDHGAPLALAEIVLLLHRRLPPYCFRSLRVAGLAEIRRIPRHVYTTTSTRPSTSEARVTNRCSSGSSSGMVMAISSWRAVAASAKSTPCVWRLSLAFSGSHSTSRRG